MGKGMMGGRGKSLLSFRYWMNSESRAFLLKGIGSLFVRGSSLVFGFLVAIVLARNLGADGYGAYSFVFALIMLITIPAQFGIPQLVLRETAKAASNEDWKLLGGVWRWSILVSISVSVIILAIGAIYFGWTKQFGHDDVAVWSFGLLFGVGTIFLNLNGSMLIGLSYPILGQLATQTIRPALFLVLIVLFSSAYYEKISVVTAMALHALAVGASLIIGIALLRKRKPLALNKAIEKKYDVKDWLRAILPLSLTVGMQQINLQSGIIILGIFVDASEIGIYRLAAQMALLTLFFRMATIPLISPQIASLSHQKKFHELQKIITLQSRVSFLGAIGIVAAFIIFGQFILEYIGGSAFVSAYNVLIILSIGYMISAFIGSGEVFLVMAGSERQAAIILGWSIVLNIILLFLLIPLYGIEGAAIATSIAFALRSLATYKVANQKSGVKLSPIG